MPGSHVNQHPDSASASSRGHLYLLAIQLAIRNDYRLSEVTTYWHLLLPSIKMYNGGHLGVRTVNVGSERPTRRNGSSEDGR
jgi:hypothetical protein